MTHWKSLIIATLAVVGTAWNARAATTVNLATNGTTQHAIVKPENPSVVDDYAVETLAKYLKEITGAEFAVVESNAVVDGKPYVFVGSSAPMRERLGEDDPLANLADQEHVARNVGQDVFLYGKGIHANLWAVMEFLENSLSWRWYSVHEDPVVPKKPTIALEPFNRKKGFSIKYRQVQLNHGKDFFYQNGINMGYALKGWPAPFVSKKPSTMFVHSTTSYIPSLPKYKYSNRFKWQDKKNYFETNPEFFSMNEFGERVPNHQLCFGNPALRKELTKMVLKDIELNKDLPGDGLIITIDAADHGGKFCHCPECVKLEKKYKSIGGPLYDYIIELAEQLKKSHPKVLVRTLAYRRSQTQHPPVLPDRKKFPDNVIVSFAPIEDDYHADWWNHRQPDIQETYRDLLGWSKIVHHLWAWIYPNPWGTGAFVPVGNIERLVNNIRLMKYAGLEGLFADHNGVNHRNSFHELQAYLMYQLMKDVNCDANAVVKEFTDHHYGAAGELMRTYIAELEEGRKSMEALPEVSYNSKHFDDRTFPYLTSEKIHRWQTYFDEMENLTADQPEPLSHVQLVRRKLDFATLWKWIALNEKYPDYFTDYESVAARIHKANEMVSHKSRVRKLGESLVNDFILKIKAGGKNPPLPPRFKDVDPAKARQYIPVCGRDCGPTVEDAEAAYGYAAPVDKPDAPFNFGFYQDDRATRDESAVPELPADSKSKWTRALNKKFTLQRTLTAEEIVPGEYKVYELGEIEITPNCQIWFSTNSWRTQARLGKRLYEPGADNKWKAYASLKFDGPSYGGKAKKDQVLTDRVILISTSEDQFKK